jgi:pantoate--beta-alanine ligase
MQLIRTIEEMREETRLNRARQAGTGLVPTMGALHEGHLALVRRARSENEVVVLSIFVNPTQFSPGEDFETYPRELEADLERCREEGVDVVFAPEAGTMYPPRHQTTVQVHELASPLEGMSRGRRHFAGVCTVVLKLLNIVQPDRAYFGQKDAQQAVVIQRMVTDLNVPTEVALVPTVREEDGLAMSSRNRRLPPELRPSALRLVEALREGRRRLREGERSAQALGFAMAESVLADRNVELDYLEIVSPETLEPVERVDDVVLVAGAIKVGGVRLIDNMLMGPEGPWED